MLNQKRLFLFDIDGTITVDNTLYEGTKELVEYIHSIGGKAIYITNNSTKSCRDYIERFKRWGIETDETNFVTASFAACKYLKEHYAEDKIFVCGTKSFVEELRNVGLKVTEEKEEDIACVIVGFDNEFTYQKGTLTCEILLTQDVAYLATNPDLCCPTSFGSVPDCGAICEFLACAVKKHPYYIGKPNREIVDICREMTGFRADETIVVGDRLYTDIACGINAGVETAVVFTGETKKEDIVTTEFKPDYAFENIQEFLCAIKA